MTTTDPDIVPPADEPDEEPAAPAARVPRRDPMERLSLPLRWLTYGLVIAFILSLVKAITGDEGIVADDTWSSALELTIPIALAGLGGLWSERAGIVNIGLEGMMALGTWFGAWGCIHYGPWAGVIAGVAGGALGGLLHAVATITFGVDHIVSGVAINILGTGFVRFMNFEVFGSTNDSPQIPGNIPSIDVPGLAQASRWLADQHRFFISDIASVIHGLTADVSLLVVIGLAVFPATYWILWRTPLGLRLRSVGEDPVAAESLGIHVYRLKYLAVVVSGALAGLGGVALVDVFAERFHVGQTNGRGFIGLAAMIFGNWNPAGLLAGAGLFGLTDSMSLQQDTTAHALLLFVGIVCVVLLVRALYLGRRRTAWATAGAGLLAVTWYFVAASVPTEIIAFLPHLTTLLVLVFAAQRLRPPAADGRPYRKGQG
jgi:ABC-type uncharacterized transport system permease subunit